MLSFSRRTLKEIPKVTSDTSFDQETIPGGRKQLNKTHNRYLEHNCAQYNSKLTSEGVEQALDYNVGSDVVTTT